MTNQDPQYIQTVAATATAVVDPTIPTEETILEAEVVQVHEPRIKPQPISVISRPLSAVTTIQVDVVEVAVVDGDASRIVISEPLNIPSYIPYSHMHRSVTGCCCHVNKDCTICVASMVCVAAMILSGIR